jgi:hypothetical protein
MNPNKSRSAALAVALLFTGAPVLALAMPNSLSTPIVVNGVDITRDAETSTADSTVHVSFTNTSNVTATEVVFELDVNGAFVRNVDDVGEFAPGVTIKHAFEQTADGSEKQVKVVAVRFADGSTWGNVSVPDSALR